MPLTNWQILITALLTAGVIFSSLRYGRGRLSPPKKVILITLRIAWIIGLLLSFLEPTLRFERFESGNMRIPVLIDVSASMQNFSPDLYVAPFLDTLSSLQAGTNGRVSFEYFLFGDSTRAAANRFRNSLSFTDNRSIFPTAIDDGDGRFSNDMIIISDGHWTRPRRASEIFPRNTIHYLVLPESDPNPFVTVAHSAPETTPGDTSFTVGITASGYVRENGNLTVSLKEKNRVIRTETIQIEQGHFSHTFQITTKNSTPGRRLYTVEAAIDNAETPSVSNFVHQTIPHFLTYSVYSAKPTLDRRYMTQALASNNFFRERAAAPDILFLFDWDTTANRLTRALPRHGAAVFLGALPCSTGSILAPSITVRQVDDNTILNTNLDLRALPPPQEIITCRQLPVNGMRRILQATLNQTGAINPAGSTGRADNIPILFTGRFAGRQSLFCPVKGIWRWDFWPMSTDRAESELFSFSNTILSIAREMLLDNISDQLILYPAAPLTETDSARFMMSLPAAVPIFELVKLSLQIQNEGNGVDINTVIDYTPQGLNRQPISFPALPPGRYAISASLDGGGVRAAFSDSFTVNKDMSELSVLAQNTQYLQEFAQPLDMQDAAAVSGIFYSWDQRSAERFTVVETVRFHRSWLLLGVVFVILAVELVLRRVWGID
ncbi:MAG: hypothetical protein LBC70_02730 [Chitinispirillales bacterium]|jgi:hypothetical protein|nr:hypothetical protein [Chitinispirillales bacterium]